MIMRKSQQVKLKNLGGGSHQPSAVMGQAAGEGGSAGQNGGVKSDVQSSSKHEPGSKASKRRKVVGVRARVANGNKVWTEQEQEAFDEAQWQDEESRGRGQGPQNLVGSGGSSAFPQSSGQNRAALEMQDLDEDSSGRGQPMHSRVDRGGSSAFPQSSGHKRAALEMACNMLDSAKGDAAADALLAPWQLDVRRIVDGRAVPGGVSKELEDIYNRHTKRLQYGAVAEQLGIQRFRSMSVSQQSTVVEQTVSTSRAPDFLVIQFDGGLPSHFACTPGLDANKCSQAVLRPSIAQCASTIPRPPPVPFVLEIMHLSMEDAEDMMQRYLESELAPLMIRLDGERLAQQRAWGTPGAASGELAGGAAGGSTGGSGHDLDELDLGNLGSKHLEATDLSTAQQETAPHATPKSFSLKKMHGEHLPLPYHPHVSVALML